MKYLAEAQELIRPERNTLTVDFRDVETYKSELATTIQEEYYRYCFFSNLIHYLKVQNN